MSLPVPWNASWTRVRGVRTMIPVPLSVVFMEGMEGRGPVMEARAGGPGGFPPTQSMADGGYGGYGGKSRHGLRARDPIGTSLPYSSRRSTQELPPYPPYPPKVLKKQGYLTPMSKATLHAPSISSMPNFEGKETMISPATEGDVLVRLDMTMGRARVMAERLTRQIILGLATRNAGHGSGDGARSPAGPARPAVETVVITEEMGDGTKELRTPLGMKTARLRLPRVLRRMPDGDGRRLVALRYVTLQELIDAPNVCADLNSAGAVGKISDGGATYRVGLAEELRAYQWAIGTGIALAPKSRRGRRRPVTDRIVVDMVCLGGVDLSGVLRAHGWSLSAALRSHLEARVFAALDRMRDVEHWASKGA